MPYVLYARQSRQVICESFDAADDIKAITYAWEAVHSRMQEFNDEEAKILLCDFNGAIVWRAGDQAANDRVWTAVAASGEAPNATVLADLSSGDRNLLRIK